MDDTVLLDAFVRCDLERFGHREHVRVAFAILQREGDLARAVVTFRDLLKRFARSLGAEGKYHETLTWAYMIVIAERMHGRGYVSSNELLEENPDLLDHKNGAIARYYDIAAITASPLARAVFVLPERR